LYRKKPKVPEELKKFKAFKKSISNLILLNHCSLEKIINEKLNDNVLGKKT